MTHSQGKALVMQHSGDSPMLNKVPRLLRSWELDVSSHQPPVYCSQHLVQAAADHRLTHGSIVVSTSWRLVAPMSQE
jgi:hypothetical protein